MVDRLQVKLYPTYPKYKIPKIYSKSYEDTRVLNQNVQYATGLVTCLDT